MYEAVQFRSWFGLLLTLMSQPALVMLQGSYAPFQQCSSPYSPFADPSCFSGSLDHAVLVVGYSLAQGTPYWVIRNSWGAGWCNSGYAQIVIEGGDGICGINVLPAYYPIPAPPPGDPCYTNSINPPTLLSRSALNPCGGGQCTPAPEWGPYSYTCQCPLGFVPVNNTVNITLPGAALGITQTCAPVDACGLSFTNPCGAGTCINDDQGGYSCICPLGFVDTTLVDGSPSCNFAASTLTSTTYTVRAGVTCSDVAAAFLISTYQLTILNDVDCSGGPIPVGTVLQISNPDFSCSVVYTATTTDRSRRCSNMLQKLPGFDTNILGRLNPSLDCNRIKRGQLVCLKQGSWPPPTYCTQYYQLGSSETCSSIISSQFNNDPVQFYALNPGIDCDALARPGGGLTAAIGSSGLRVCTGASPVGTTSCPKPFLVYTLQKGDACVSLVRKGKFRSIADGERINLRNGFKCSRARVGQVVCARK